MSRPFESFEFLNRGWDIRVLEGVSLRSLFVMVAVLLFTSGMLAGELMFEVVRFHRCDWSNAGSVPELSYVFRYSRLIYRRLSS